MLFSRIDNLILAFVLIGVGCCYSSFQVSAQGSGQSLFLNGSNQFVDIGDEVINNTRTIELWFMPGKKIDKDLDEPIAILARDEGAGNPHVDIVQLFFMPTAWGDGGTLNFSRMVGAAPHHILSDNNIWMPGHWYHVAAVLYPDSGMRMYINGELQKDKNPSTQSVVTKTGSPVHKVSIGRWGNRELPRYFGGELDEIRIWSTARTEAEIRQYMCSKVLPNQVGLKAYYKFDESGLLIIKDESSNSYQGTTYNMSADNWITSGAPVGDESNFAYTDDFSGRSVSLIHSSGDLWAISEISGNPAGAHIYRIDSKPLNGKSIEGNPVDYYYGVFLTSHTGLFSIEFDHGAHCTTCYRRLYARNSNKSPSWTLVKDSIKLCKDKKELQGPFIQFYRAEYWLTQNTGEKLDDISRDWSGCLGTSLMIDASTPNSNYLWSNDSTQSSIYILEPGSYWVKREIFCDTRVDTFHVSFEDCSCQLRFPDAFSPNNDGINDFFEPKGLCSNAHFELSIYNRWGQEIFNTNSFPDGWDGTFRGKPANQGSYLFIARYTEGPGKVKEQQGVITLVR